MALAQSALRIQLELNTVVYKLVEANKEIEELKAKAEATQRMIGHHHTADSKV